MSRASSPWEIGVETDGEPVLLLRADGAVYPLLAVQAACYAFLDRAYVHLDLGPAGLTIAVRAKGRGAGREALLDLAGELGNELLAAVLRLELLRQGRSAIEATTREAFAGALGPPSIDDLLAMQEDEDPFDDPLGITVPWQEQAEVKSRGNGMGADTPARRE